MSISSTEAEGGRKKKLFLTVERNPPPEYVDASSVNSGSPLAVGRFEIGHHDMTELHDPKSIKKLHELGGIRSLEAALHTNLKSGLNTYDKEDMDQRRKFYGANRLPVRARKNFFQLCFEAMKDKVLILLSVAAVVSLALGLYETFGTGPEYEHGERVPKVDWVEGVAIIVAIVIVVVVGAANDFQKERQFAKLNAKKEDRELAVIRNGNQQMISIYDLQVGDIMCVETGDIILADSILVSGEVECDESSLTGETDTIRKVPANEALKVYEEHLPTTEDLGSREISFADPFLISGSKTLSGRGHLIVTAVGLNSIHGRTMASLSEEGETTPLQERLDGLAEGISKYGFLAALILFIVLFIRFCIEIAPGGRNHDLKGPEKGKRFMDILITSITIVVVAVPEGLPLAVTLALAFATTRMAQNGNLVRVLRSCETMGGATAICSDKTGTLTENRMRIVKAYFGSGEFDDTVGSTGAKSSETLRGLPSELLSAICENIVHNSSCFENQNYDEELARRVKQRPKKQSLIVSLFKNDDSKRQKDLAKWSEANEPYIGNKTESALMILATEKLGLFKDSSLEELRSRKYLSVVQVITFESSRKWSGLVMRIGDNYRLYVKGAAEIVLKNCGFIYNANGEVVKIDRNTREEALNKVDEYANDALRAITLCHRDFAGLSSWPPAGFESRENPREADPDLLLYTSGMVEDNKKLMILDGTVGIQDPLKEGIPEAVNNCKLAGVSVRMVTGDNLITAKAISRSCNILTPDDLSNEHAYMEGPAFRKLSPDERKSIAPDLRVLARSSPEDKRILVETLRSVGEVVAVTGDGTNDAPALKLADVGFSMGIAGTEVAREASDIILMTDDFTDIVQAIKWGRTVASSIKKFIQFQLTVNITACVLTFVSAVASSENKSVLTAVQLLWVNLIMDTLAALALATDKPDDSFLRRKPAGRNSPLISVSMWKLIIGEAITQLTVTFILHFAGDALFFGDEPITTRQNRQLDAMTFNTFVWLQFWKLVVCRKLDEADEVRNIRGRITRENLDFSQHLFRNWYFIIIAAIIGGCQVLIMFVGGAAFSVVRQTPGMWATALLCGFISIPVGIILRIIPNHWVVAIFPTRLFNCILYYLSFSFLKRKRQTDLEIGDVPNKD